ncbi:YgdI/YgdR family lipoprotein [Pseudodesulfovibrio sp. zrk46]|uniref:YgdI/YgdR family lipoprotein n=1 Tax=Pseudodesulfovibrio sp. zrk46 TaxID=2725288 RepID=UPI0014497429|nr:YgdI/YgdR family lipoprotein [Pseudodesulfovibrio sp. zrk46]QJB57621.1 YgdI/YgdR family lipoprotein [Pseudodesulfovibrio sp. zrk46]
MNRFLTIMFALLLTCVLAGCGAKTYQVTTKAGKTYTAKGSLEYDVQSETYKFKNDDGKEVILNQEDIEVIQETK